MRHLKSGRKLGRDTDHRLALMSNLAIALFTHERIHTTEAKAKELRRVADKMVTFAKRGDLHSRRMVARVVRNKFALQNLFDNIAGRFIERNGGYTRIIKTLPRRGDGASMALIELVDNTIQIVEKKKKESAKG
ncbi:MAG: 50S ribosomal protein L17 [Candidatus Tectomicrobia bacterium]|uniref:Large ribosomal subunit protein bL17 n=1 Tax=Tectimicrobiota bacterium TaxID=2528274 RepID=A0A933LQ35_UNCTE|nr:50S ribosomal protein L17 [Candidatus Tectomicrobia bacterium]